MLAAQITPITNGMALKSSVLATATICMERKISIMDQQNENNKKNSTESTIVVSEIDVKPNIIYPRCWKDNSKKPKRYNEDGSLRYVLVLVCLYNKKSAKKLPKVAKYEEAYGWVDENNLPIESEEWVVSHWTTLTPPPCYAHESTNWSMHSKSTDNL